MSEAKYILREGERFEREGGSGNEKKTTFLFIRFAEGEIAVAERSEAGNRGGFPRGGGSEALEPHGFKAQGSEQ